MEFVLRSSSTPFFSVVIPVHGRQKVLEETLSCMLRQRLPARQYEVLVVINGDSSDEFTPLIFKMGHKKNLRFFFQRERNASLARNLGVAKARGRWLVFIDSDCQPHPDWLENVKKILLRKKQIKILGGPVLDYVPPGVPIPPNYRLEGWERSFGSRECFLKAHEYLMEGNLVIHRSIWQRVGGFRCDLGPGNRRFGFHEGTELQSRIKKILGSRQGILYSPRIPIRHVIQAGRTDYTKQLKRIFLSGFDYPKAFPPQQSRSKAGQLFRAMLQCVHYPLVLLLRPAAANRVLFRMGELWGLVLLPYGIFPNHVHPRTDSMLPKWPARGNHKEIRAKVS